MVANIGKLSQVLESALTEYNETNATMDLVLFEDAMKHVARIVRVIMNSGGAYTVASEIMLYLGV